MSEQLEITAVTNVGTTDTRNVTMPKGGFSMDLSKTNSDISFLVLQGLHRNESLLYRCNCPIVHNELLIDPHQLLFLYALNDDQNCL